MNWKNLNLFFFCIFFFNNSYSQSEITVGAQKPINKEVFDILELPGSVLPNESIEVTSVVSEKIKKILFKEGKSVKKNQLLVELVDNEEQAQLSQAQAEFEEAELNYNRAKELSKKGNISQSILDNRLTSKKKLLGKIKEIKAQIADLKIRAPFDGLIGIRNYSEGSFVKPGDVIAELYDVDSLKIQAFIPESYSGQIKKDVNFVLDIDKFENINGKISVIDPVIDKETRTFKVLGKIKNTKEKIKPGMMINLKIQLRKRKAFMIRENAIIKQDDLTYVYLVEKKNTILKKQIEVGTRTNGMIEVRKGLDKDDLIVYEGINKIKEGSKVNLK